MKRLTFIAILASCLLTACGTSGNYSIKGIVSGVEDGTVMTLNVVENGSLSTLDSVAVSGGRFAFKGSTDTTQLAVVTYLLEGQITGCQFFLENGTLQLQIDALTGKQHLEGTPNNDAFQEFYDATDQLDAEASEIDDKIRITMASQGDCTDLYRQMEDLQHRFLALLTSSIKEHADKRYAYQQLMDNYSMYEPEEVKDMLKALAPTFGTDPAFNQLTAMINAQLRTSFGQPYIDFEAPILGRDNKYSTKASLSTYVQKNKIVLLDFWASWCSPCMGEVPNLKAAYKRFKSKGFEIVSVSVDDDVEAWLQAVKDNSMNWVQLWNGPQDASQQEPAALYSVTAIPCTYLIDNEGTIIGRNLRGDELEKALEDYFK